MNDPKTTEANDELKKQEENRELKPEDLNTVFRRRVQNYLARNAPES